jgi:hypothetical protein
MTDLDSSAVPPEHGASEPARRRAVRLVFLLFWMLMFEGAVRKWVAPQYSAYLYFVRDPVLICLYVVAMRHGLFMQPRPFMTIGLVIAAIATVLSAVHLAAGGQYTLVLAVYGFRNYFLYLPLPFVIARCFNYDDLTRMARFTMLAMIIAAPIAVLQFESSPSSVLNRGIATDQEYQFDNLGSSGGRVRPAGTFTSVMGMTQLTVATVAMLMWSWAAPRWRRPASPWLVRLAVLATATALAVGGSRTSFIQSCLVIIVGIGIAPFLAGMSAKLKSFAVPLLAVVTFAVLFPIVFPDAFQAFAGRWQDASATESRQFALAWVGRIFYSFYDFSRLLGEIPLFGYGIGTGGNGAVSLGVSFHGVNVLKLAEEDWSRHVIELGPVLAILFILYRVSFGVWLALRSLRATLSVGDPLPVLLFAYCGVALVEGQITGHGLVNGFGWLYVGFCLAAGNALRAIRAEQATSEADAHPARDVAEAQLPNLMR